MELEFKVDEQALKRAESAIRHMPQMTRRAISIASNTAVDKGKAAASKLVREVYTVKAGKIREAISVKRASAGEFSASLIAKGGMISPVNFTHSPRTDTTGSRRRPIMLSVKRNRPVVITDGFKSAKLNNQLYRRVPGGKNKIERLSTVSVPQMMGNKKVSGPLIRRMQDAFEAALDRAVDGVLKGFIK